MNKMTKNGVLIAAAVAATLTVLPTMAIAESTPTPTTNQASNSCCHSSSTKKSASEIKADPAKATTTSKAAN